MYLSGSCHIKNFACELGPTTFTSVTRHPVNLRPKWYSKCTDSNLVSTAMLNNCIERMTVESLTLRLPTGDYNNVARTVLMSIAILTER